MSSKKMTEAAKAQKTLNAVRSMMSESAQNDVPVLAEGDSISKFANPILNYKAHTNEFISVLVDRIMFTAVEVKRYSNRLARLKRVDLIRWVPMYSRFMRTLLTLWATMARICPAF